MAAGGRTGARRRISLSLRNRLVLVFSAIVFAALAVLYLYVAPGLQSRLVRDQEAGLASAARAHSEAIAHRGSSRDLWSCGPSRSI